MPNARSTAPTQAWHHTQAITPSRPRFARLGHSAAPSALVGWLALWAAATWASSGLAAPATSQAPQPAFIQLQNSGAAQTGLHEGVIEAVRHSQIAAQVAGAVTDLNVKAGDRVKAGQWLLRIDARAAEQSALAGAAQAQSARATLELARADLERQRQLHQKGFISDASMDRAQSQYKASAAQAESLLAQADAARTQSGWHQLRAPFDGIVAEVMVVQGDMALPGRPLLTLYDPRALRAVVALPQDVAQGLPTPLAAEAFGLQDMNAAGRDLRISRVELLPVVDAASHTQTLRLDLSGTATAQLRPGQFVRINVPGLAAKPGLPRLPLSSLLRRGEVDAVYVLDTQNRPMLRQVRLGRRVGDSVEVLAGLSPQDRVLRQPQLASTAAVSR